MLRAVTFVHSALALASMAGAAGLGSARDYESGAVHARIMHMKNAQWDAEIANNQMDSAQYPELAYTPCVDGFAAAIPGDANNTFRCSNIDLYHFLSHADLGSKAVGQGSSSWGWTSDDGREFVAIGQFDGTAFAEISPEGKLVYLGRLPQYDAIGSRWREIRVLRNYVVIGSEAVKAGVQIFDLRKLLDLDPSNPTTFSQSDLTGHWDDLPVGRTHNIVVNEELNYAIAAGSVAGNETVRVRPDWLPCRGGLIFINMTDPANPTSPGCAAGDGYVHDAQCLVYRGPDTRYYGRDICYGYNEDTLTIYDVTDKVGNVTNIISVSTFPGAEYVHQGVVNDEMNQEYLFLDDEFDERDADVGPMTRGLPTTHIYDIRDLENPIYTGLYEGKRRAIDHNQYVVDGLLYQSNYGVGLTVLDIASVPSDPTGAGICEAGFFDIYPEDDEAEGGGIVQFAGSWSSYAYFKSGYIFVHTIERGSFVVKMTSKTCPAAPTCGVDACSVALRGSKRLPGRQETSRAFCGDFLVRQRADEALVPDYAREACAGTDDVKAGSLVARVSSACSACVAPTVVPELPRTTSRSPVPTVLPPKRQI